MDYTSSLLTMTNSTIFILYDIPEFLAEEKIRYISLEKILTSVAEDTLYSHNTKGERVVNLVGMAKSTEEDDSEAIMYTISFTFDDEENPSTTVGLVIMDDEFPHLRRHYAHIYEPTE